MALNPRTNTEAKKAREIRQSTNYIHQKKSNRMNDSSSHLAAIQRRNISTRTERRRCKINIVTTADGRTSPLFSILINGRDFYSYSGGKNHQAGAFLK